MGVTSGTKREHGGRAHVQASQGEGVTVGVELQVAGFALADTERTLFWRLP